MTDLPIVGHPTRLHVRVPRFTSDNSQCETKVLQQRMPSLAEPRAKTTRRCTLCEGISVAEIYRENTSVNTCTAI